MTNKIKQFRSEAGMTVRGLSELAGVAVGYLSALENDTDSVVNPTKEVMERISTALGKTVPEVFFPGSCATE